MASKWNWRETEAGRSVQGKGFLTQALGWLNSLFNENHAWFDYDKLGVQVDAITNKTTGADLTPAEKAANQFTADEAQKQRDFEEYMSSTAYQRQVKDMQAAGINPAMAMSGSGASTPSGASASSVAPQSGVSFSDLMQLIMMPMQKKLMQAQAGMFRDQGQAALINAGANVRNAGANERNAGTNERNAGTNERNAATQRMEAVTSRMRAQIEKSRVENINSLNDEEKKRVAAQTAFIDLQREQLPKQLEVAQKNADSQAKHAIAALRQADAAVQNAATNDRLADYETSLKYTQELLTWYQAEGQKVIAQYLPEKTRAEIDNIMKEGIVLDERGRLVHKQGNLVDAQMVKTYVNVGTDISGAVNQWLNPLSKGPGSSASTGFDLSGAYQGVAYGYD